MLSNLFINFLEAMVVFLLALNVANWTVMWLLITRPERLQKIAKAIRGDSH